MLMIVFHISLYFWYCNWHPAIGFPLFFFVYFVNAAIFLNMNKKLCPLNNPSGFPFPSRLQLLLPTARHLGGNWWGWDGVPTSGGCPLGSPPLMVPTAEGGSSCTLRLHAWGQSRVTWRKYVLFVQRKPFKYSWQDERCQGRGGYLDSEAVWSPSL